MASKLIRGGFVLTMDPALGDLPDADVLVEGDAIAAVGPGLDVEDAEVIDASGRLVLPGFVDAHRHTWQATVRSVAADWTFGQYFAALRGQLGGRFTPEDVHVGTLLGMAEALDAGVTTVYDWSHIQNGPEHTDAAVEALVDSRGRAVFAYGDGNEAWLRLPSPEPLPADARRVAADHAAAAGGRITLALALRGPEFAPLEVVEADFALAAELGLPVSLHVGCGTYGMGGTIATLHDRGLLREGTLYAHCCTLTDDELDLIAGSGGCAVVTPEVEMHMGLGLPATTRLLAAGVPTGLGVDVVTGVSGDLFGAMRAALAIARATDNQAELDRGRDPSALGLTTRDVLRLATLEGARAIGLEDRIGSLSPGKQADVVVLGAGRLGLTPLNNPCGAAVMSAAGGDVEDVLVAGELVKRAGALTAFDLDRLRARAESSRDRLFAEAGAPADGSWDPLLATA